jgi:hypothetical protein
MAIHFGPFIVAKNPLVREEISVRGCESCKIEFYADDSFCSSCGSPVTSFSRGSINSKTINEFEVEELLDERMIPVSLNFDSDKKFTINLDYFISNMTDCCHIHIEENGNTEVVFEYTDGWNPNHIIEEFKEKFKKEIAILKEHYGEGGIEVKFGILNHDYS